MPHEEFTIRCTLKEYRRRKGLSQDELGQLVGLRRQAIYDMESGRYLPNTAVALQLARVLGCTVEMLFVTEAPVVCEGLHLLHGTERATTRLSLALVRDRLVGIPLLENFMPPGLDAADGFLLEDNTLDCRLPQSQLSNTVLMLGCDPALSVLRGLMHRLAPGIRAHTTFASSRRALLALSEGNAHVAGTHYHPHAHGGISADGNINAVQSLLPEMPCLIMAFALQEEGLMVAQGNPLGISGVEDMAGGKARLANREEGAALRKLLDSQLAQRGIPAIAVQGYTDEVPSHSAGAMRVASGTADAALGLRVVAQSFGLNFVPLAVTRCDLVIPMDLRDHAGLTVLLDILQSADLRQELWALPGYDAAHTGKIILRNR